MSNWSFFWKCESRHRHPHAGESKELLLALADDLSLVDALAAARAAGMPVGSHRAGCFEVQSPLGLYTHPAGNRIDPTKPHLYRYQTWAEWEASF